MRFSLLLLLVCASCAPVYVPIAPSMSLVTDQGEMSISAGVGGGTVANLNVAYGVIDNLAIMAETGIEPGSPEHGQEDRNFYQLLGAVGYAKRINNFWRMDAYVGGGIGTGESYGEWGFLEWNKEHMKARFSNYFAQFDIGFVDRDVETGYQLRANYVKFDPFHYLEQEFGPEGSLVSGSIIQGPTSAFFLEHSFIARRGGENLKAFFFITLAVELTGRDRDRNYHLPLNTGFGLQLRLNSFGREE